MSMCCCGRIPCECGYDEETIPQWEVKIENMDRMGYGPHLMDEGWEPFSASDCCIYLKRRIN